ncbi:hypothetical protein GGR55DRAFT_501719 [Xylaria sp. FL0064]|nr:hypothetical protein GGR55DRAFT_501719 [Xylaria sp. FL0064]
MELGSPYTLKWGIMATGNVAEKFAKDLLTDPTTRDVHDVRHQLVAVASSSGDQKAVEFCGKIKASSEVRAYGTYSQLVLDSAIDIIYVATPSSHHFQNAMLALEAGKSVLCEKPFTVTSSQARKLIDTARTKKLFLMEAVWTRFFPLSSKISQLVGSGAIGSVYRVIGELYLKSQRCLLTNGRKADNSLNGEAPNGRLLWDDAHRMINLDLAGGAMLDLGIYSLSWIMQILYHLQPETPKERPSIVAAVNRYRTGADEMTSFIVQFPNHKSMGIGMTALRVASGVDYEFTAGPPIRIQGSKGEIQVLGPAFKPKQFRVIKKDGQGYVEVVDCPFPKDAGRDGWGHGMYWEADECARCLRDKKLESDVLPLDETLLSIELMESVLRAGDVHYPVMVTNDVYDIESPHNASRDL